MDLITVSGKEMPWEPGLTIEDLLKKLDPSMPMVVVRMGGKHISRHDFATTEIEDGESIDVVYVIAGG